MAANKAVSFAEVGYTIKERHLALESIRLSWGYTGYAAHCDL